MSRISAATKYYEEHALQFAQQATDIQRNDFEYAKNIPSLLSLTNRVSGVVLDFGCGAGNFTQMLARNDRVVEGCDTSPTLLGYARDNSPKTHLFLYGGEEKLNGKNIILSLQNSYFII